MEKYYLLGAGIAFLALIWNMFVWFAERPFKRLAKKDLEYKIKQIERNEKDDISSPQLNSNIKHSELEANTIDKRFLLFLDKNDIDRKYANNSIFLLHLQKVYLATKATCLLLSITLIVNVLCLCFVFLDTIYFVETKISFYTLSLFILFMFLICVTYRELKNNIELEKPILKFKKTNPNLLDKNKSK